MSLFRTPFAEDIFRYKYQHENAETWDELSKTLIEDVCGDFVSKEDKDEMVQLHTKMQFIAGGRYLYYAGRKKKFFNNCFLLKAEEDTREDWANLSWKAESALLTGGGVGIDYSIYRAAGSRLSNTGGVASGPIPKMMMINEIGRFVQQGGARRCLAEDSMISMSDGSKKPIQKVVVGDLVATRFGPKAVTNVFDQGIQSVLEITTSKGSVRSSYNHKWLTGNPARMKTFSVRAQNLSLNHKLYWHASPVPTSGTKVGTDRAYLLGYYLGDGCAYHSGNSHEVSFQVAKPRHNTKHVNYLVRVLEEVTGHAPHVRKGHGDVTEVAVSHKKSVDIFQKYKKPHQAPVVPQEIFNGLPEDKRSFLAGWFDADGYYGKSSWKLANKHEESRKSIQNLLFSLGYYSTIDKMEVRLCSYQHTAWRREIFPFAFKKARGHDHVRSSSEIPTKIQAVKFIGNLSTYDIEVEDVHEFIADGFVSHNSAVYGSLLWEHADAPTFLKSKNWDSMVIPNAHFDNGNPITIAALKTKDFNFHAPLDMTNISLNYNNAFLEQLYGMSIDAIQGKLNGKIPEIVSLPQIFLDNVHQAMRTGEPGFSFNFFDKENETLRNACGEICSEDDSDVCNLTSLNLSRINTLEEFRIAVRLATMFLICGTIRGDLPYEKVYKVRNKNRRLGLGLMGVHEWLLQRGYKYEVVPELHEWLRAYRDESEFMANQFSSMLGVSRPIAVRSVAPTGTIGIMACSTTGIEPLFATAYKRRYLKSGHAWHYQYVIDGTAKELIHRFDLDPMEIETAMDLAKDPERRIKFQADVQSYVDQAISSTINLTQWNSPFNNEERVEDFAKMLGKYAHRLRGFTVYPDSARGGQPLTPVNYHEAISKEGEEFEERFMDICELNGAGCGI